MHDIVKEELPDYVLNAPRFCANPRAAARALRPIIEAKALESEKQGYLHDDVIRGMADAGLFGLLVPKELGGTETDPETYIDVVEQLSYADGSAGWVFMAITFTIANATAWLGQSAVDAIYKKGDGYLCAGQIAPLGKAERVDGGYRVTTVQQFGSGSRWSSWLLGSFMLQQDGKPKNIWGFAPRRNVRLRKNSWDVMGLQATASYDFEFVEQVIPDDFIIDPANMRPRRGGPLFEIGVSMGHVSWALGVGMRILDEMKDLARRKRRQGRASLIDQPVFQQTFAEGSATVEACRAYVRSVFHNWYEAAKKGTPSLDVKMQARLASCWATQAIKKVGENIFFTAGSDGLRNNGGDNRLQRCFRDLQAGSPHRHVDQNILLDCSTVLLGVNDPNLPL